MKIEIDNRQALLWNQVIKQLARHWAIKKKMFDEWEEIVHWAVYQTKNKPELPFKTPKTIKFEVWYKDKRRRDPDGVCIKILLDSLVKAGVLVDDSYKEIEEISIRLKVGQPIDKITINIL